MDTFAKQSAHFFVNGPAGRIEVLTSYPHHETNALAIICHPHPRHHGTMHNKVVTILAKTFEALGMATLRFNFRGVGQSAGEPTPKIAIEEGVRHYECQGELEDLHAILHWVKSVWPQANISLAGFSFGSYVAAKVAEDFPVKQLISIAPPVERMPFAELTHIQCSWLVVQGDDDEIVSAAAVNAWAAHPPSPLRLIPMNEVGHFFHGKLNELREVLIEALRSS